MLQKLSTDTNDSLQLLMFETVIVCNVNCDAKQGADDDATETYKTFEKLCSVKTYFCW